MRLPFATICVAISAFRAGVGSYAASSRSIPKPPRSLLGVATKRHLRLDKLEPDDEERVRLSFDLNKLPGEEEIVGETSESLGTEIKELQLLKEREQLVKPVASEEKITMEQLLYDWDHISRLFKQELVKAKTYELNQFLNDKKATLFAGHIEENLKKLQNGWKVPDKSIEGEWESSTEGLQAWLEKKEIAEIDKPVDNVKSALELFEVLGIHKAVDKAANSLLISMNLERWNFVMMSLHKPGEYNFEHKLQETLKAYCRDDDRAKLFLKRLCILHQETRADHLKWLHAKQTSKSVFNMMKGDPNPRYNNRDHKIQQWIPYQEAYNDLHPKDQKTFLEACPLSEANLVARIFNNRYQYPTEKWWGKLRILEGLLKSWATLDPPLSPAGVLAHLWLLSRKTELSKVVNPVLGQYLIYYNAGRLPHERVSLEVFKESLDDTEDLIKNLHVEKGLIMTTWRSTGAKEYLHMMQRINKYLESLEPKSPSKRKAESPLKMHVKNDDHVVNNACRGIGTKRIPPICWSSGQVYTSFVGWYTNGSDQNGKKDRFLMRVSGTGMYTASLGR